MRRFSSSLALVAVLALLTAACGSSGGPSPQASLPGRASLSIVVEPNPIIARPVSGGTYDFPFAIALRETGGVAVSIDRVSMEVTTLGGSLRLYDTSYDSAEIARMNYPTSVAANGEIRYSLNPRKEVPDERLFGGVEADLRVDGTDTNGNRVFATTTVTVRK